MSKERSAQTVWNQGAYLACVAVLVLGIVGMSAIERALGFVLKKEPLPANAPLTTLAFESLTPYEVVETFRIEDPALLMSLGTEDYIQWVLQDTRRGPTDPTYQVLLFVTYYALPDRIPHVPEECYLGNGFQRLAADSVSFGIPAEGGSQTVKGRCLVFSRSQSSVWSQSEQIPVVYLFRVNGEYAANRDEARLALNKNMFGRASYFSKVELVFNRGSTPVTKELAQAAAQDILALVLPVLERDHWPTWPPTENEDQTTRIQS